MDRFDRIRNASILGIIGNIFLLIIKGLIGFTTGSIAMIGDFFNSAGDIFSSLMTFIGNKIASQPKDEDHDLGHGKAEYIYSMLISIVMALMAYQVLKSAIVTLINKEVTKFSIWLIIVCIITIITKLSLYLNTNRLSKKYNNLLLLANSKDHRNDCLLTTINLISCILTSKGIYFFDKIAGIIIAIFILISAIKIFKESYDVLMDKSLDKETKDKVYNILKNHPEIKKYNHFNSTPIGYLYQISLTIFVDGELSTFKSHDIANNLEKEIIKEIPEIYLAVIHVNPIYISRKGEKDE